MRLFSVSIFTALLVMFAPVHFEAHPVLTDPGHQQWALELGNLNEHLQWSDDIGFFAPRNHDEGTSQMMSEPQSMAMMSVGLFLAVRLLRRRTNKSLSNV